MGDILVIGVGSMGFNHARVCSEIGVLAGVCDLDQEAVKRVGDQFAVPCFSDIAEAISQTEASGVIVATPTQTHHEVAMMAIELGLHALVEKPMASNLHEVDMLLEIAKEREVVLAVGHVERYNPVIAYAKERLVSGDWGEPVVISSRRVSNFPSRIRDVGVILDLGIHDIDNAIFLMGSNPISVFARGGRLNNIQHEDHATLTIGFENGRDAIIEVNWITPMKVRKLSLTCERSFVELDYMKQHVTVSSSKFVGDGGGSAFPPNIEFEEEEVAMNFQEPLKLEVSNFLEAMSGGGGIVDGNQARLSLQVALLAMESLDRGEVINIG